MKATLHVSDLTHSLLPRALEPDLPKAEEAPVTRVPKDYELTAVDEPGPPFSPASAEDKWNPLLDIVEQGMDAGGDPVARKVPHNERSTVGTIGPLIH